MFSKLIRIFVVLLVLLVVLLVGALIFIDHLAKAGIQIGATQALGVNTTLDKINIGLFSGKASLAGLNVAEPEGFKAPHFLNLKQGSVAIALASLTKDVVEIPRLELSGIDMFIEKNKDGKANYQVILDNLKKPEPAQTTSGKKFVIREVVINDISLHADVLPIGGPLVVKVPEIRLKNVGSAGENGVDMAELINVLVKATLASAIANGKNILPGDLVNDVDKGLKNLGDLATGGVRGAGGIGKQLGSEINKTSQEIGKGLDQLFGSKKEEKK